MDEISEEDQLDRQLREAAPYIDDNGFTARVLHQLPGPRRTRESLRGAILLAAALLASALAYVASDGGRFLVVAMARLTTLPTLWLFALAFGSGILVMTGGVFAAISKTSESQS
jgi:anti-sigma factor RsiW